IRRTFTPRKRQSRCHPKSFNSPVEPGSPGMSIHCIESTRKAMNALFHIKRQTDKEDGKGRRKIKGSR
ncbi:MAG: hypothetical protein Q4D81_10540, partial [Eubacteriales bacterium]|nr:hypothetical protein [Eubacteriales bacterium]